MTVFLLILIIAGLMQLAALTRLNPNKRFRENLRIATGAFFVLAGVSHFLMPDMFLKMMPPVLPWPLFLVYISGVFEILGGIGLILSRTKIWAAIGLVVLLAAVFPANIYAALNNIQLGGMMNNPIYQWIRLPMQLVLIALVVWCGGIYPRVKEKQG
jgi:uncharacterized membrane protein